MKKEKKIQNARPSLPKRASTTAVLALTVLGGVSVTSGTAQAQQPVQVSYSPAQSSFELAPEFISPRERRLARECESRRGFRWNYVRNRCERIKRLKPRRLFNRPPFFHFNDERDRRGGGRNFFFDNDRGSNGPGRFGDHDGDRRDGQR